MPQRLGTVPHTESINAKSISSKKPYQVAITQRYPARNQNVRYCMHSPLALYCACQPGRRSQRGVQYHPASPIYQILPIVYLLMNPKRQPSFAILYHILQYFTICFDILSLDSPSEVSIPRICSSFPTITSQRCRWWVASPCGTGPHWPVATCIGATLGRTLWASRSFHVGMGTYQDFMSFYWRQNP